MFVVCLYLGLRSTLARRHERAMSALSAASVRFYDGFEEPPGPNWMYTWSTELAPPNGFFPAWFRDLVCIQGSFECYVDCQRMKKEQIPLSGDLLHLRCVLLTSCDNIADWVAPLARLRGLHHLGFKTLRKLSDADIALLGTLETVPFMTFESTTITFEQVHRLRTLLPECEIEVY